MKLYTRWSAPRHLIFNIQPKAAFVRSLLFTHFDKEIKTLVTGWFCKAKVFKLGVIMKWTHFIQ